MIYSKSRKRKSAGDMAARIISDLLNPLTMPLLVFGVAALSTDASLKSIAEVMGATTLLFFIIPFVAAIIMLKVIRGDTLDFPSRSVRSVLYFISIVSIGFGGFLLFNEIYSDNYRVILTIYLVNLAIAMGINFKWKASVHMGSAITASVLLSWLGTMEPAGTGALLIAVLIFSFLPILAWARIQLRVHSRFEILLGGLTGLTSTTLMILFLA